MRDRPLFENEIIKDDQSVVNQTEYGKVAFIISFPLSAKQTRNEEKKMWATNPIPCFHFMEISMKEKTEKKKKTEKEQSILYYFSSLKSKNRK